MSTSRHDGDTLVQQRGETAVLGLGRPSSLLMAADMLASDNRRATSTDAGSTYSRLSDPVRPRAIARRKLQRRDNARLASNPHVIRPSPRDYSLRHNEHVPSFPLPSDLQTLFLASTTSSTAPADDMRSAQHGGMRMSYTDAHWFLANRVGVRPNEPQMNLSAVQQFAKMAEAEIVSWLGQTIFLHPDRVQDRQITTTTVDASSSTASDDQGRITEVSRTPHNLVWQIADPFKRLTVHCLARVYGCATFSKDSGTLRQTWILKNRTQQAQQQQRSASAATTTAVVSGRPRALPRALETPPTTDVGTDMGSELASVTDADSDWAAVTMSDVDEVGSNGAARGRDDSDIDDDGVAVDDGDETMPALQRHVAPHRMLLLANHNSQHSDDEADHFADVES